MTMKSIKSSLIIISVAVGIGILMLSPCVESYSLIKDLRVDLQSNTGQCQLKGMLLEPGERQNHPDECLQVVCFRDGSGRGKVNYCPWDPDAEYLDTTLPYPKCCKTKESKTRSHSRSYFRTPGARRARVNTELRGEIGNEIESEIPERKAIVVEDYDHTVAVERTERPTVPAVQRTRKPAYRRPTKAPVVEKEPEAEVEDEAEVTQKPIAAPTVPRRTLFRTTAAPTIRTRPTVTTTTEASVEEEIVTEATVKPTTVALPVLETSSTTESITEEEPVAASENSSEEEIKVAESNNALGNEEVITPEVVKPTLKPVNFRRPRPIEEKKDEGKEEETATTESASVAPQRYRGRSTTESTVQAEAKEEIQTNEPTEASSGKVEAQKHAVSDDQELSQTTEHATALNKEAEGGLTTVGEKNTIHKEEVTEESVTVTESAPAKRYRTRPTVAADEVTTPESVPVSSRRFRSRPTISQQTATARPVRSRGAATSTAPKIDADENYPNWYKNKESTPPTLAEIEATEAKIETESATQTAEPQTSESVLEVKKPEPVDDEQKVESATESVSSDSTSEESATETADEEIVGGITDRKIPPRFMLNFEDEEEAVTEPIEEVSAEVSEKADGKLSEEVEGDAKELSDAEANADVKQEVVSEVVSDLVEEGKIADIQQSNRESKMLTDSTAEEVVEIAANQTVTEKNESNDTDVGSDNVEEVVTNEHKQEEGQTESAEAPIAVKSEEVSADSASVVVNTSNELEQSAETPKSEESNSAAQPEENVADETTPEVSSNDSTKPKSEVVETEPEQVSEPMEASVEPSEPNDVAADTNSMDAEETKAKQLSTSDSHSEEILIPVQVISFSDDINSKLVLDDSQREENSAAAAAAATTANDKVSKREDSQKQVPITDINPAVFNAEAFKHDSESDLEQQRPQPVFDYADFSDVQQQQQSVFNIHDIKADIDLQTSDDGQQKLIDPFLDTHDLIESSGAHGAHSDTMQEKEMSAKSVEPVVEAQNINAEEQTFGKLSSVKVEDGAQVVTGAGQEAEEQQKVQIETQNVNSEGFGQIKLLENKENSEGMVVGGALEHQHNEAQIQQQLNVDEQQKVVDPFLNIDGLNEASGGDSKHAEKKEIVQDNEAAQQQKIEPNSNQMDESADKEVEAQSNSDLKNTIVGQHKFEDHISGSHTVEVAQKSESDKKSDEAESEQQKLAVESKNSQDLETSLNHVEDVGIVQVHWREADESESEEAKHSSNSNADSSHETVQQVSGGSSKSTLENNAQSQIAVENNQSSSGVVLATAASADDDTQQRLSSNDAELQALLHTLEAHEEQKESSQQALQHNTEAQIKSEESVKEDASADVKVEPIPQTSSTVSEQVVKVSEANSDDLTQQRTTSEDAELQALLRQLDANESEGQLLQQRTQGDDPELRSVLQQLSSASSAEEQLTQQRTLIDEDLRQLVHALQDDGQMDELQQRSLRNDFDSIEPIYKRMPGRYRLVPHTVDGYLPQ